MKRYFISAILALAIVGCGGGAATQADNENEGTATSTVATTDNAPEGAPTFAPQQKQTVVTRTPVANQLDDPMRFQGSVRFMIVVPEDFDAKTAEMLQNKLMAIASVNGVGAIGGDPGMCMVPVMSLLSADVTATAPVKHKVTYNFGLYVGNNATGDIYGSVQHTIMGVGDSQELAMINAVSSISIDNAQYQQMLEQAQERVIEYINANGDTILAEAKGYLAAQKYAEAMAVLNTIPNSCTEFYAKAVELKNEVLTKEFYARGDELLAKMEAALGSSRDYISGICAEAMSYYAMIPAGTEAKAKADAVYTKYVDSLDPEAKKNWERELREWESAERELERSHELNMYKEEMAAKVAVEGQTALLAKYKADDAYSKKSLWWKISH